LKIIPLFHYTLNPQGILFLGPSESIGEFTDLFQPLNFKWKIFQRKESFSKGIIDYPKKIACTIDISISPVIDKGQPPGLFFDQCGRGHRRERAYQDHL